MQGTAGWAAEKHHRPYFCLFEIQRSKSSLTKPSHQDLLSSESQHQPQRERERERDGSTFTLTPQKKKPHRFKITLNIQSSKCLSRSKNTTTTEKTINLQMELVGRSAGRKSSYLCGREGAIWFPCWAYPATVRSHRQRISRVSPWCLPGRGWMQYRGQRLCLHKHPSTDIHGTGNFGDKARVTDALD